MFYNSFLENRVVYDIGLMSKNMVEPERSQMILRRRFACWISKATCAQADASARVPTSTDTQKHTPTPTDTHTHSPTRHHTHTHRNIYYVLLFHRNSGYANVSQCYVIRVLPLLLTRSVNVFYFLAVYLQTSK